MGDSMYGRLFTEDDLTKLVAYAFTLGRDGELNTPKGKEGVNVTEFRDRVIREVEARSQTPYTFPLDGPLFLLREADAPVYTRKDVEAIVGHVLEDRHHAITPVGKLVDQAVWELDDGRNG
jgi:hypothetical protein